eukprot:PITA_27041
MESPCQVILDSTNYFQWVAYMEDLLRSKGLYRIATGQEKKPTDEDKVAKLENRQDQARGLIGMSISPDLRFHIAELDTPHEALEKITKGFGIKNEIRAHQLENELLTLDPNNFSCIEDFLSKFKTLRYLLEGVKIKKEDSNLIYFILTKLGPAYSVFVSTFHSTREAFICQRKDYKAPSFDSFCDSLIREQEKLLHLGLLNLGNSSKKALADQQQPNLKNPKKSYPKKNGPKPNKSPKQTQPQKKRSFQQNDKTNKNKWKKTDRHCNFCNRDGHLESKCFKKMEALEAAMKKHNIHVEHSSTSTATSSSGMALSQPSICILDNSFSEGKIVEFSPHDVVIKDLRDPKQILATGIADDSTRLYKFHNFGSSNLPSLFVAHNDEVSKLWHERFGHLNYRSLQHLCKENMVTGLPMVSCRDGVCSGCVLGQHHRDSFEKRASWHASAPLQLVHSDLCGPLSVASFSGCKYFLTFIDDFSRRTWVYFLKLKSEVFNTFLAFKAFVEKQSGHQILKLRTDNGGEYVKNTFINFCTENGIQMQHTVPYTPQQNGVAERKNRTLKEMANCMLQSKGLSLSFWAEAINCANYIINRTPTKVLKNITPEEAWSSIKPDVSHFRIFGSEAWAHIPDEKHKALEPKSEKCTFVGYSEDVKGYRLIPFKSKNVIIGRDVKFDENKSACEPSPADVPPLPISSTFENISSSDDESEDDTPPPPSQDPQLPRWVRTTRDAAGDLVGDPTNQRRTRSHFERASSLLAQAPVNHDPDTFAEALGHPHWEAAMIEEYHSLLANDTWDLVPLPKGRKLVRCKWVYRTKYGPDEKVDKHKA